MNTYSQFIFMAELLGTVAFAVSGVLTAKQQRLDLFGAVVLGVTTAVGGGVIRDLLLGSIPPVMFREPVYALLAFIASVATFTIERHSRWLEQSNRAILMLNAADTIGLGVFAVSGTEVALLSAYGSNRFLVIFVGMITAVGGGVLRDMLGGQVPMILRKRIYAVAALIGVMLYMLLRNKLLIPVPISGLISVAAVSAIRFLAIRYHWNLPTFDDDSDQP